MAKKKTKFKQLAEHIIAGGFVSQPAMVDLDMFRTKIKPILGKSIQDQDLDGIIILKDEKCQTVLIGTAQ